MKRTRKIEIDFTESINKLPFIEVKFEGVDESKVALLDTGSEITLLDERMKDVIDEKFISTSEAGTISIDGFGGSTEDNKQVLFATTMCVTDTNGDEWKHGIRGILMDFSSVKEPLSAACPGKDVVAIIGSDTMHMMKAQLDYKKRKVIFK